CTVRALLLASSPERSEHTRLAAISSLRNVSSRPLTSLGTTVLKAISQGPLEGLVRALNAPHREKGRRGEISAEAREGEARFGGSSEVGVSWGEMAGGIISEGGVGECSGGEGGVWQGGVRDGAVSETQRAALDVILSLCQSGGVGRARLCGAGAVRELCATGGHLGRDATLCMALLSSDANVAATALVAGASPPLWTAVGRCDSEVAAAVCVALRSLARVHPACVRRNGRRELQQRIDGQARQAIKTMLKSVCGDAGGDEFPARSSMGAEVNKQRLSSESEDDVLSVLYDF
ncbi:MAG: hypothetical protein SGPRY_014275, partial [Prymnesium sp.]